MQGRGETGAVKWVPAGVPRNGGSMSGGQPRRPTIPRAGQVRREGRIGCGFYNGRPRVVPRRRPVRLRELRGGVAVAHREVLAHRIADLKGALLAAHDVECGRAVLVFVLGLNPGGGPSYLGHADFVDETVEEICVGTWPSYLKGMSSILAA